MSLEDHDRQAEEVGKGKPRVTLEHLKSRIANEQYSQPTGTLTLCVLTVDNGYTLVGKSACASPENFDEEYGRKLAYEDALRQLWPLEAYLLCEHLHKENANG